MKFKALIFAAALLAASAAMAAPVTTADLLRQQSSLEWLGRALPAGTRTVQFSSYDRSSQVVNGATVNWYANADTGQYLRVEDKGNGKEWVMAEGEGPGAIVRMWSANPGSWKWRVYIDGKLAIEEKGTALMSGEVPPWEPPFSHRVNLGANFNFPILFAKSFKVTAANETQPMMYYQVQVRFFAPGAEVKPFNRDELKTLAPEISAAAHAIESPPRPEGASAKAEVELAPGAEGELFRLSGPAAVYLLRLTVAGGDDLPDLLGRTQLLMDWDGEKGVAAPLGDFFGTSPGANAMRSMPMAVIPNAAGAEFVCRFVMPFARDAVIRLKNQSRSRLKLTAEVVTRPWPWGPESLHFHAGWREKNDIRTRPFSDLRMLGALGRGHFVGLEMNVRNPLEYFWWGEGDERIWVDNDRFPSTFGTGTEDYFGYAWCLQFMKFTLPYHGVSLPTPTKLPIMQGLPFFPWETIAKATPQKDIVSQYRFQILDAIPFEQKLNFDMEISHHRATTIDVNATAWWYSAPGGSDDFPALNLARREVWKP